MAILPLRASATALLALFMAAPALAQQPAKGLPSTGPSPQLPAPDTDHTLRNETDKIGWKDGQMPVAPPGFTVSAFATDLDSPRWLTVLDNGDVLVAEAHTGRLSTGANRITLLRDVDKDGIAEEHGTYLDGLNQPFGMAVVGNWLYVGNTDAVMRYPYSPGLSRIEAKGEKILDLPAGGYNNHWTRNLLPSQDGKHLFVTVGSGSNVAEHGLDNEKRRANILQIDLDGKNERIYASGLRNPVGAAFEPETGTLWTAVNERDNIGEDLVPDYITGVKEGAFYGWPFAYWGPHEDPRMTGKAPDMVAKSVAPDFAVGAHTATLGLAFAPKGTNWPAPYNSGAFLGQHGSWNRQTLTGYKVAFVPFKDGKPSGEMQDFLTGFLDGTDSHGRPVGTAFAKDGALLVADDDGNTVWRVVPAAK